MLSMNKVICEELGEMNLNKNLVNEIFWQEIKFIRNIKVSTDFG